MDHDLAVDEGAGRGVKATRAARTASQRAILAILAHLGVPATDVQIVAAAPEVAPGFSPSRLRSARSDLFRLGEVALDPAPAWRAGRKVARWALAPAIPPAPTLDERARKHLERLWAQRDALDHGRGVAPSGVARTLHYEIAFLLDVIGRPEGA